MRSLLALPLLVISMIDARAEGPTTDPSFRFPTVRPEHRHAQALLANSLRYFDPAHKMVDAASGYPFEGWNQDPKRGLYLRSFTQLTAIGQYMELLANVAAGLCDTPLFTRRQAIGRLTHLVKSLRQDQRDATLSAQGMLGNFLDLATGKRLGPLAVDVEKGKLVAKLGAAKGEAVWKALAAKGWIKPRNDDTQADIVRSATYGYEHFDGVLAPFADEATRQAVMGVLDQRVVMVVFIDNANLSSSAAKTIGALLRPEAKDEPGVREIRDDLERLLADQQAGYDSLYDPRAGQFYFGRDATKGRYFGWIDLEGKWVTGHVDYLVNEFRGPATFVVTRFGQPLDAIANLGFKLKPYAAADGRDLYVLAPWEGSAFQALGLELSMTELDRAAWRTLLRNVVDVEIDYATRHGLPGFLSESYSGEGVQYTGSVGIPDITVSPLPRITDAASLYTLGAAYTIEPDKVDAFLAANWPAITRLLTDHGPWEGFKGSRTEVIAFQTTAHTLALTLGLLGTGSENMKLYLESKGLSPRLDKIFRAGDKHLDLLSDAAQCFAWNDKSSPMQSSRDAGGFHAHTDRVQDAGIAFVAKDQGGLNLSGGLLTLRYRSKQVIPKATIALKAVAGPTPLPGVIPTELSTRLAETGEGEREIEIPLPATPGLLQVKEVVLTFGPDAQGKPIDLTIAGLRVSPITSARD
ncbi:hypothetical protein OJF2_78680 (plasmid) [Aquisphaera giovannonii]|uniref:Uncharacterized protein n=1 Tax=Aquisphaera giovannonii TaxID=406548 RepID=A0A5B9WFK2_9BACT|nr:hypothetical protein [Aquisphaera giovannonii]QEH39253.1 hypothetical protein OJF2_78680 [Aquisphaera giovannonii]